MSLHKRAEWYFHHLINPLLQRAITHKQNEKLESFLLSAKDSIRQQKFADLVLLGYQSWAISTNY